MAAYIEDFIITSILLYIGAGLLVHICKTFWFVFRYMLIPALCKVLEDLR